MKSRLFLTTFFAIIILILVIIGYYGVWHRGNSPYNLVLITIDTLRADHLSCYGDRTAQTPHIHRLAQGGVLFTRALAQSPLTLPSHASILTGTNPTFHKIRDNNYFQLRTDIPTLASLLELYDYQTAAVVSAAVLARDKGLARGFQQYDDVPQATGQEEYHHVAERRGEASVQAAIAQLQRFQQQPAKPFFLWLHLYDPHAEYTPPSPFADKFAKNPYDGEIAYTDSCLGRLFQALQSTPAGKQTLIVLTADHGEGLGEHGEPSHGYFLYNSTLHIPLIFHAPGLVAQGETVASPVRSIEIMPTVLSLLGIENHGQAQGQDIAEIVKNPAIARNQILDFSIYSETFFPHYAFGWRVHRAIVRGHHKFIASAAGELYDLENDPNETHNLLLEQGQPVAAKRSELAQELERFLQQSGSQGAVAWHLPAGENPNSLGYYSYPTDITAQPDDKAENSGPDASDMTVSIGLFVKAQTLLWQERPDEAIGLLETILQQDPGNITVRVLLGKAYTKQNKLEPALAVFEELQRLRPQLTIAHEAILDLLLRQNETTRAKTLCRQMVEQNPHSMALSRLAYLELLEKNYAAALSWARKATIATPQLKSGWFYLGRAAVELKNWEEATGAFRQALQADPEWGQAWYWYGLALAGLGQQPQAQEAWNNALSHLPHDDPLRAKIKEGK